MMDLAAAHPDINYLGIERYSSVLLRALQKMEENPLPNLFFICMDAADVAEVFDHGEVDRIYLNFSDPWPKDRHAKRRLTSRQFFARYDEVLAPEGHLEFKTDNQDLFYLFPGGDPGSRLASGRLHQRSASRSGAQ